MRLPRPSRRASAREKVPPPAPTSAQSPACRGTAAASNASASAMCTVKDSHEARGGTGPWSGHRLHLLRSGIEFLVCNRFNQQLRLEHAGADSPPGTQGAQLPEVSTARHLRHQNETVTPPCHATSCWVLSKP